MSERRQQVAPDVVAVLLERALVSLARLDLLGKARQPPAHDSPKPQARRYRHLAAPASFDQPGARPPRLVKIIPDGSKTRPAARHEQTV
jgi:hypothetical protein